MESEVTTVKHLTIEQNHSDQTNRISRTLDAPHAAVHHRIHQKRRKSVLLKYVFPFIFGRTNLFPLYT